LIGWKYSDLVAVQKDMMLWPFKVVAGAMMENQWSLLTTRIKRNSFVLRKFHWWSW